MNYANSILETFEYFCRITSKSIFELYRFKVGLFFRHSVEVIVQLFSYEPHIKLSVDISLRLKLGISADMSHVITSNYEHDML